MAAGPTYEPIATTTLGSAASSITFSSIPATYTDLRLVFMVNTTTNSRTSYVRFNSDSGSNYSGTFLEGNGTAASSYGSGSGTSIQLLNGAASTTQPTFATMDIFSYAGSTFKTSLNTVSGDLNGSGYIFREVYLYRSTTAISTLLITTLNADTFGVGTTATLYGILKA